MKWTNKSPAGVAYFSVPMNWKETPTIFMDKVGPVEIECNGAETIVKYCSHKFRTSCLFY